MRGLDRALPGRVVGFYVVGSAALGVFREHRSDVDFVAIVDGALDRHELARLRAMHRGRWIAALVRDVALRRRWPLVCNGSYLESGTLSRSPLEVVPLAAHVAGRFAVAERRGFDVNPVTWHMLARHGVAVRGPAPDRLDIRIDPVELRDYTLDNLDTYWRGWADRARRPHLRRFAACGALGVSRLHYTLASGTIASKEDAGEYALEAFALRWRPLIEDALAYWRGGPPAPAYRHRPARRTAAAADFVSYVIADAQARFTARTV